MGRGRGQIEGGRSAWDVTCCERIGVGRNGDRE